MREILCDMSGSDPKQIQSLGQNRLHMVAVAVRHSPAIPPCPDLLPWALLLHCSFGLWMHSYFAINEDVSSGPPLQVGGFRVEMLLVLGYPD